MRYLPHWRITIIAAIIINLSIMTAFSMFWDSSTTKPEDEKVEVIDWIDVDETTEPSATMNETAPPETTEVPDKVPDEFPPLIIPPLPEIPKYVPEPLPTVETPPKPDIKTISNDDKNTSKDSAEKLDNADENSRKKIKVISKVYPKDVVNELIEAGLISEAQKLQRGSVLVQVLIGVDGKVKKTEIKRGGGYDERGNIINTLIEYASSKWLFEPYLDDENQPKEMPTQIEFKPDDF